MMEAAIDETTVDHGGAGRCGNILSAVRIWAVGLFALLTLDPATAQLQFGPGPNAPSQNIDTIVAVVEDDVITRSELDQAVEQFLKRQQEPDKLPPEDILERQILEQLIIARLQLQAAERSGIVINDTTLNAAIAQIAQRNEMSLEQLRRAVETSGTSFSRFRADIRLELMASRLQQRAMDGQINISEQEIDNAYEQASASAGRSLSREEVQQLLLRRKAEEEWELWLQQQRDEAYIELRL